MPACDAGACSCCDEACIEEEDVSRLGGEWEGGGSGVARVLPGGRSAPTRTSAASASERGRDLGVDGWIGDADDEQGGGESDLKW